MSNKKINEAIKLKNDEFYTLYEDIEKELKNYSFENKTIYCNCDDPRYSNFCKYFLANFDKLKLKRLIVTGMSINDLKSEDDWWKTHKNGYILDISCFKEGGVVLQNLEKDVFEILKLIQKEHIIKTLQGDGSFESKECLDYLKEANIVVTNPPFSIFNMFFDCLVKNKKDFIIIGSNLKTKNKNILKMFFERKLYLGYNEIKYFKSKNNLKSVHGTWFTTFKIKKNLSNKKRGFFSKYYKTEEDKNNPYYKNNDFEELDFFKVLVVKRLKDIPLDYKEIIAVPSNIYCFYNNPFFELLGINLKTHLEKENYFYQNYYKKDFSRKSLKGKRPIFLVGGKQKFERIFIKIYPDEKLEEYFNSLENN